MNWNNTLRDRVFYILVTLYITIFTISFIHSETGVYWADLSGYSNLWKHFSQKLFSSPSDALLELLRTIRNDDYNEFPVLLLSPFFLFPMGERLSYILSLILIYLFPLSLLIGFTLKQFNVKNIKSVIFLSISFSAFWIPTLRGYPDISGLVFIILSIYILSNTDLSTKRNIKIAIILGIILWLPFAFRRWYIYTIISLYLSLPFLNYFIFNNKVKLSKILNIIVNFFISGIITLFFAFIFQKNMLIRIMNTSYSDIYSAYQTSVEASFYTVINYLGGWYQILFLFGLLLMLFSKDRKKIVLSLFCLFNFALSFSLFTKTQAPGMQHNLPFALFIFLICMLGISELILISSKVRRIIEPTIVFLLSLTSILLQSYVFFNIKTFENINKFSSVQALPIKFKNQDGYYKLKNRLEELLSSKDKVTVFSSSDVLNEGILAGFSPKLSSHISPMSHVDLRDLFNIQALMSKYVIVTAPGQFHLPKGQSVILAPNKSILDSLNIGNAYKLIDGPFKLDNNVSAYIYEKQRAFSSSELDEFFEGFYKEYPEWRDIYNDRRIKSYLLAKVELGNIWGDFSYLDNKIIAHPGEDTPTKIEWNNFDIESLHIEAFNTQCNINDPVKISLISDSKLEAEIFIEKGKAVDMAVHKNNLELIISKVNSSGCDGLYIIIN